MGRGARVPPFDTEGIPDRALESPKLFAHVREAVPRTPAEAATEARRREAQRRLVALGTQIRAHLAHARVARVLAGILRCDRSGGGDDAVLRDIDRTRGLVRECELLHGVE